MQRCNCKDAWRYEERSAAKYAEQHGIIASPETVRRIATTHEIHARSWQGRIYIADCPHNSSLFQTFIAFDAK